MENDVVVSVKNVSKDFKLPHEKADSVKSLFVNPFDRNRKKSETQHALRDISFDITKGEFFGIVGRNGSGKSTLLKIIAGIYQPNKGEVKVSGKLVPFIELGVGFNPRLTGRENVYLNGAMLGFSEKEVDEKYEDIVDFAELERFMDQKLKNYSSGMQVRLAFSVATILAESDVLLVDEVLAVGDVDFQRKCFSYFKKLKKDNKTVIFVSHDMSNIREFCTKALLIDNSKVVDIGSPDKIAREYSELFIHEIEKSTIHSEPVNDSRWGNKNAKIESVATRVSQERITTKVRFKINKPVEKIMYGIHIVAQDGVEITAMNNQMVNIPDIEGVHKGDTYVIKWDMLNVFNDGTYTTTITLVDGLFNALDWWLEADTFIVKRAERSTTAVFPPLNVEVKKDIRGDTT